MLTSNLYSAEDALDLLEIETTFIERAIGLRAVLMASDDEIAACVALANMSKLAWPLGKRKRDEDGTNTDLDASPATKVPKPSHQHGIPRREMQQPEVTPRQRVTKESLQSVRDRLASLTSRNQDIKNSIHTLRQAVIDELFSHMKVRQIAIGQLGRDDLEEEMHQLCTKALWSRRDEIYNKQNELTTLEELLGGHRAVLEFADSAYEELEQNIKLFDTALTAEECAILCAENFPAMSKLARLTGGSALDDLAFPAQAQELPRSRRRRNVFPHFGKLPVEIRVQIWQEALPGPRIVTHNSRHNRHISPLTVNRESRAAILTRLTRILSPTFDTTTNDTKILYVNLNTDIIIRDLANPGGPDTFTLDTASFNSTCYRLFIGLAKVKRLALAFDVLHNNGGQLFGPLQSCCPELESLVIFPTSMVEGGPLKLPRQSTTQKVEFIDIDSNVIDYIYFRWELLSDRKSKRKALRGIAVLLTLYDHAQQYYSVFPEYIEQYGRTWAPKIRVALMMKWNEKSKVWQTRNLEGDKFSKGYRGIDGKLYRGFVESGPICGSDGEVLSRYDGMVDMFEGLGLGSSGMLSVTEGGYKE